MLKNKLSHWLLLGFLIVVAFSCRFFYKLDTPLADWHSWRQADTVSVTREYIKHGYSFWLPHFQDLSNIPSGLDNLEGYRMVEFPVLNYGIAQLILHVPSLDLVVTSRVVSIVFSLISVLALYWIVFGLSQKKMLAFLSSFVLAVLPYSVYYSRTTLPEPAMLAFQLLSVLFCLWWVRAIKQKSGLLPRLLLGLLTIFSFAMALLLKPFVVFIAPVMATIAFWELGFATFTSFDLWIGAAVSVVPLLLWRNWIAHFPAGIPANTWLFNGNGIRLRPAWWRWLFADRFGRLILGYWGLIFLFLGLTVQEGKKRFSLFDLCSLVYFFSMMAYLIVVATGNVQHDYYQIMLTPIIAILVARGVWSLQLLAKHFGHPFIIYGTAIVAIALTSYFSWYEVSGYYNINNPAIVEAGKAVDQLTPPDAKVIAPYGGDTAFLFQTNRTGWPVGGLIDEKIKMGAQYYVTTTEDDEAKKLEQKYPVIAKTSQYVIVQLK